MKKLSKCDYCGKKFSENEKKDFFMPDLVDVYKNDNKVGEEMKSVEKCICPECQEKILFFTDNLLNRMTLNENYPEGCAFK